MANELNETNTHSQILYYNWLHFDEHINPTNEHITINKCYQCYINLYSLIFSNKIQCCICLNTFCKNCANKELKLEYNNSNTKSKTEMHIQLCNHCYYNYIEYNKNMIEKANIHNEVLTFKTNSLKYKDVIANNITNIYQTQYEEKLKEMITNKLTTNINEHIAEEYGVILYEGIKNIMYNIQPLYSYIDNSNIGVQIIENENESNEKISKVVNGFIMKKYKNIEIYMNSNTCSQVVDDIINNPRIN